MILVDTSVWVRHFRMGDKKLAGFLDDGEVACHSFILGEVACGNLKHRSEVLSLLKALPSVPVAEDDEVMLLLEREKLYGKGMGWIDAHLLGSALLGDCALWALEASLKRAAAHLRVGYSLTDR
jgi:predicted nucleic acid-binding protein